MGKGRTRTEEVHRFMTGFYGVSYVTAAPTQLFLCKTGICYARAGL